LGERRGWKNGERWEKMRETGDKGKKGEKGERKDLIFWPSVIHV
jgi:hypothetical protein